MWHTSAIRRLTARKPQTVKITRCRHPSGNRTGDTAAVNPEDPRYKDPIGKFVILPLVNRRIPIVGDEHADSGKGTGCGRSPRRTTLTTMKVGKRHGLPMIDILTL